MTRAEIAPNSSILKPSNNLTEIRVLKNAKDIPVSDYSPYIQRFPVAAFDFFNFGIITEVIHDATQGCVLLWANDRRTDTLLGQGECEIIWQWNRQYRRFGSVRNSMGWSMASINVIAAEVLKIRRLLTK